MPVEQREQVTHVEVESTGNRMSSWPWWKAAAFVGWHEPDESRDSRPDLWGTRGEIPRVYPAVPPSRQPLARCDYCAAWREEREVWVRPKTGGPKFLVIRSEYEYAPSNFDLLLPRR